MTTRRDFLRLSACGAAGMAAFAEAFERFGLVTNVADAAPTDYKALVCIFLFGGNDGNNMIVPMDAGYTAYSNARNAAGLALGQMSLLPITPTSLGVRFGFHPSLVEVQDLWTQGKLAVVANVGPLVHPLTRAAYQGSGIKPYQLFSHSDQQSAWQAIRSDVTSQLGWGGRTADIVKTLNGTSAFPPVTSLAGNNQFNVGQVTTPLGVSPAPTPLNKVLVLNGYSTAAAAVARRAALDTIRGLDGTSALVKASENAMQQALDIGTAFAVDPTIATTFPTTGLGNQLKQVAKIIKLNQTAPLLGLNRQIFFCSLGGFDTHQDELTSHATLYTQLSQALNAFSLATQELALEPRVTTFTLSDFGRTLQPSGSGGSVGSDHAWGNHQLVMGGSVRGGDFFGVPGLNGTVFPTLQLGGPDDTDTRGRWIPTCAVEQYASTLAQWFGVVPAQLSSIFPNVHNFTTTDLGFLS
jgi:uncharacterized protein (DUF1501 family)